ncbi:MAG TPA: PAS domain-containing sensor histidine kinase [Candidatus Saccharimonadales bacterium]|jgi:PAS domain S-box-containing protein
MSSKAPTKLSSLQSQHDETQSELKRYKLLVDSVQDYAIFLMDSEGYIQTWNKGAQRNKGYAPEEIIGKHFSTFYMERDIVDEKPARELMIARKLGRVEDEDWRVRKDGSRFWANVVITALHDETGELVGFAKVTRNLTDRKQQEDDLRDANVRLRQQGKELMELNASKDEFISLASHQLRTPATGVKQVLGLILEGFLGDVPEQLRVPLEKAYDSNERQIAIINSLLKVAQIDAGKVVLKRRLINVNDLVIDIVAEHSDVVSQRGQTISLDLCDEPAIVYADQQYLRMALENLLDNASKYNHDNGSIRVSTRRGRAGYKVSITDTGVGIGKEHLGSLFEKFRRIPNDRSQQVFGSGLGLYWVQKVIRLHDGTIEVASEPGKGTTFCVSLPERINA